MRSSPFFFAKTVCLISTWAFAVTTPIALPTLATADCIASASTSAEVGHAQPFSTPAFSQHSAATTHAAVQNVAAHIPLQNSQSIHDDDWTDFILWNTPDGVGIEENPFPPDQGLLFQEQTIDWHENIHEDEQDLIWPLPAINGSADSIDVNVRNWNTGCEPDANAPSTLSMNGSLLFPPRSEESCQPSDWTVLNFSISAEDRGYQPPPGGSATSSKFELNPDNDEFPSEFIDPSAFDLGDTTEKVAENDSEQYGRGYKSTKRRRDRLWSNWTDQLPSVGIAVAAAVSLGSADEDEERIRKRNRANEGQDKASNRSVDEEIYDSPTQQETMQNSQEPLIAEVKGIYAGLVMVEGKCIEVDNNEDKHISSSSGTKSKLTNEQWQALIALHRTLLDEHHDFFLASQHPSASPALQKLAAKYAMPSRMWRHGIHSFLELLKHRLPNSVDPAFVYLGYTMMALQYEAKPDFADISTESLEDLGQYLNAIEDNVRDRQAWTCVTRRWYSQASEEASCGSTPAPATYSCSHCARIFTRMCDLRKHEKYHTKPIPCPIPNCGKSFGRQSDLARHLEGPHGIHQELIHCPSCDKEFTRKDNMNRHLRSSHGRKDTNESVRGEGKADGD